MIIMEYQAMKVGIDNSLIFKSIHWTKWNQSVITSQYNNRFNSKVLLWYSLNIQSFQCIMVCSFIIDYSVCYWAQANSYFQEIQVLFKMFLIYFLRDNICDLIQQIKWDQRSSRKEPNAFNFNRSIKSIRATINYRITGVISIKH